MNYSNFGFPDNTSEILVCFLYRIVILIYTLPVAEKCPGISSYSLDFGPKLTAEKMRERDGLDNWSRGTEARSHTGRAMEIVKELGI
jgi:hypothetical protein